MERSILVQYLRHSGFWLTTRDDVNIVIDPLLSSSYENWELVPPPFKPTAIEKADAILITHLHPDHCDTETIYMINLKTKAKVIAHPDVIDKLTLSRKHMICISPQESVKVKSTEIHAINLGTFKWWDDIEMTNIGYRIVAVDGINLFHASDHLPTLRDIEGVDILFIRIGWNIIEKKRMIEMIKQAKPKFVIPMHYGTYTSIRADPEEIRNEVETEKTKMLVFYPGQVRKIRLGSGNT